MSLHVTVECHGADDVENQRHRVGCPIVGEGDSVEENTLGVVEDCLGVAHVAVADKKQCKLHIQNGEADSKAASLHKAWKHDENVLRALLLDHIGEGSFSLSRDIDIVLRTVCHEGIVHLFRILPTVSGSTQQQHTLLLANIRHLSRKNSCAGIKDQSTSVVSELLHDRRLQETSHHGLSYR